ncbi:hypothetical protein Tco_1326949 [Tanacetum coccineum]
MTYDPSLGAVKFTNGINEISYKMPGKIKQYDSLSDLEKEHTKSLYLRNEEDKRREMKEKSRKDVLYLMRRSLEIPRKCPDDDS